MKAAIATPLVAALTLQLAAAVSAAPVDVTVTFADGRPARGVLVQLPVTRRTGSEYRISIAQQHLTDSAGRAHFDQPAGFVCYKALLDRDSVHRQGHACTRKARALTIVLDE